MSETLRRKGYIYVGLDISKTAILKGKSSQTKSGDIHFVRGDVSCLPFKRRFKLVLALEIVEHLKDPYELLVEINKVLFDGGYLVISTPNRISPEGLIGRVQELVVGKRWSAWNEEHKHIFSSFEFLHMLKMDFSAMKVLGYYFLPKVALVKFEGKWWFGKHLRFLKTYRWPLSLFGFQTAALLKKKRQSRANAREHMHYREGISWVQRSV
jgi:2-polyprenyl-3-methyl-5-hydroxy-6-metoxy-1,4-benzoquinol methylase